VEVIAQAVDTARQDSRRLLAELRQESIENLAAHLRDVSAAWAESSSAELHLDLPPVDPPLSPQAREELSRAVGELLENVSRHAQAANVSVHLRVVAGAVELVVSDDGVGVPPIDLAQLYRAGHFGLIGARERMARIGGTLVIRPGEPCGTEVTLTAPVGRAPLESRGALVAGVVPIHSYAGSEAPSDLGR
jgi:signal transduction histidine kinase